MEEQYRLHRLKDEKREAVQRREKNSRGKNERTRGDERTDDQMMQTNETK